MAAVGILALGVVAMMIVRANTYSTLSITWNASTGAVAYTAKNNPITLGSRYENEWSFGTDGMFAITDKQNSFIDNFSNGPHGLQKLVSFTINYTGVGSGPITVCFMTAASYSFGLRCKVRNPESGHKYILGVDAGWNYVSGTKVDTYSFFDIQNETGYTSVSIESFSLEYTYA
jgi:hypothetical protein